jgi:hypothetical protein
MQATKPNSARVPLDIRCPVAFCALLAVLCSSCTTLSVEDHYALPDGRDTVQLDFDGGKFVAGVNPTDRFFAVGALGVPLIPTVARRSPKPNIEVALHLRETSDHDFDLPRTLCVTPTDGVDQCSTKTLIHSYAAYQDDGRAYRDGLKRWHGLPTVCGSGKSYYLEVPASAVGRLSRDALYNLCGYPSGPAWKVLDVEIVFEVPCTAECQTSFSVSASQLVTIGGHAGLAGTLTFRRMRAHDYQPAAIVQ